MTVELTKVVDQLYDYVTENLALIIARLNRLERELGIDTLDILKSKEIIEFDR